jgi:hypothetical protein
MTTKAKPKNSAKPKNRTARAGVPLAVQAMEGTFAPKRIASAALHEQLSYRAAGNPPGTLPTTAISNCFPGLELDFRNVWKNLFVGIEMHEADNLVVGSDLDPEEIRNLRFHRLVKIIIPGPEGNIHQPLIVNVHGPNARGTDTQLGTQALEWSNALADLVAAGGQKVICEFTTDREDDPVAPDVKTIRVTMQVRNFFEPGSAVIARDLVEPGQLTQSLCSPWQNDYRECACYYWAASRPDYVNVEEAPDGTSRGENWMQKRRSGARQYQPDDFQSAGLLTYEDIFRRWEKVLRFEIAGQDTD